MLHVSGIEQFYLTIYEKQTSYFGVGGIITAVNLVDNERSYNYLVRVDAIELFVMGCLLFPTVSYDYVITLSLFYITSGKRTKTKQKQKKTQIIRIRAVRKKKQKQTQISRSRAVRSLPSRVTK
jgi:uncharacterized membrane protein